MIINMIESICDTSSVLSTDNIQSLVLERDELVNTTYSNKQLDKNLSQTHAVDSDNCELINNDEEASGSENNDRDDIDSYINDGAVNRNLLNNFERHENDVSFISQLQEWAIKNRITHVALNELLACLKPRCPELPRDFRTSLGTMRKVNVDDVQPGCYYHFGLSNCVQKLIHTS